MDKDPSSGFSKLQFLLTQNPFPPEAFANLLVLYIKYEATLSSENFNREFLVLRSGGGCSSRKCALYLSIFDTGLDSWRNKKKSKEILAAIRLFRRDDKHVNITWNRDSEIGYFSWRENEWVEEIDEEGSGKL